MKNTIKNNMGLNKRGTRIKNSWTHETKSLLQATLPTKSRRGQITIFIIILIVVLATIALFFFFYSGVDSDTTEIIEDINPPTFLRSCIENDMRDVMKTILDQGGYYDSSKVAHRPFKFIKEKEEIDIAYLCYTPEYNKQCIIQEPMLMKHINEEIKENIDDEIVEPCFDSYLDKLETEGYEITDISSGDFEFIFEPGKIIIDIDAEMTLAKNEEISEEKNFRVVFPSKIYELILVSHEVLSQEAKMNNVFIVGLERFSYPGFDIERITAPAGDTTDFYIVEHTKTKERFIFATRNVVYPPMPL